MLWKCRLNLTRETVKSTAEGGLLSRDRSLQNKQESAHLHLWRRAKGAIRHRLYFHRLVPEKTETAPWVLVRCQSHCINILRQNWWQIEAPLQMLDQCQRSLPHSHQASSCARRRRLSDKSSVGKTRENPPSNTGYISKSERRRAIRKLVITAPSNKGSTEGTVENKLRDETIWRRRYWSLRSSTW